MKLLTTISALLLIRYGDACGSLNSAVGGDISGVLNGPTLRPTGTYIPNTIPHTHTPVGCITDLSLSEMPRTGYESQNGGPVEEPRVLDFTARSIGGNTCWKNHQLPQDTLDFVYIEDASLLQNCNAGGDQIGGPAIVHYSPDGSGSEEALFHSCSILCSQGPPEVIVTGAKSSEVTMEICRTDSFTQPVLKDCTPVQFGQPTRIGGSARPTIYDIVIKATNFGPNTYAAIQDIQVAFQRCGDPEPIDPNGNNGGNTVGPTDPGPGPTSPSMPMVDCQAACEFVNGRTCGYRTSSGEAFKAYDQGVLAGNLDSGVNALGQNNPGAGYPEVGDAAYGGSILRKGTKTVAVAEVTPFQEDVDMLFEVYEACDNNVAKICFDSESNCPWSSNPGVTLTDRRWLAETVRVPAGTSKIILLGHNMGTRMCSVGFAHLNFAGADRTPLCHDIYKH